MIFEEYLKNIFKLYNEKRYDEVLSILREQLKKRDLSYGERELYAWSKTPGKREQELLERANLAKRELERIINKPKLRIVSSEF